MPIYALKTAAAWLADATPNGAVFADVADPATISGLTNGTPYQAAEILVSPLTAEFTPVAPPVFVAPAYSTVYNLPDTNAGVTSDITGFVMADDDLIVAVTSVNKATGTVINLSGPATVQKLLPAQHNSTTASIEWFRLTGTGQVSFAPTVQGSFGGRAEVWTAGTAAATISASGLDTSSTANTLEVDLTGLTDGQYALAALLDRSGGPFTALSWSGLTERSTQGLGSDGESVADGVVSGTGINVSVSDAALSGGPHVLSVIILGDA